MKKILVTGTASLLGVGLTAGLVWWVGLIPLLESLKLAGWSGLALLCLVSALPAILLGAAWQSLIPRQQRVPLREFILARMVRDAIADISPLTVVGGMLAAIRVMILRRLLPA